MRKARRDEVDAMLAHFNIDGSNPLTLITQDMLRSFFSGTSECSCFPQVGAQRHTPDWACSPTFYKCILRYSMPWLFCHSCLGA